MAYERREFSGSAVETTLGAGIDDDDLSFTIGSATGWPDGSDGWFLARIGSESVLCISRSGTTITALTRGYDDTTAASHAPGASVSHVAGKVDLDEANEAVFEILGSGSEWTTRSVTATNLSSYSGSARYKQRGKVIEDSGKIVLGGAPSGTLAFDLALPADPALPVTGTAVFFDTSTSKYYLGAVVGAAGGATTFQFAHGDPTANNGLVGATAPITWASGDWIAWTATYEVA